MSEQKKIAVALQAKMVGGMKYRIADLISLLPSTDYEFSTHSQTPNNAEPHRPRWNRWVRNAVRNSPGRTDHKTNWWTDLNAEWVGPKKNDWDYWIDPVEEQLDYWGGSDSPPIPPNPPEGDSPRPAQNDGWVAEQRVKKYLEGNGWKVFDVSREGVGFDLLARKGEEELFVEVKSSTSSLSITLTKNEWLTATKNRDKYWIAYFENFDPAIEEDPKWIQDPAKMVPTERETTEYSLPRSQWHQ